MKIMTVNRSSFFIDQKKIKSLAGKVLKEEGIVDREISIAFVDSDEIRSLNREYRGIDESTDVLSFCHDGVGLEGTGINFIGEIVISPKEAENVERCLIHGILHLLGYDHERAIDEKKMRQKEDFYFCS